jgi:hypothetical protein
MKQAFVTLSILAALGSTAQHVGINTTDPDRPLTVQGVDINSELISFRDAGSGRRWHLNIPGITGLSFNATGLRDHVLHINQFGRIGINTNQPAVALQVNAQNDDNLAVFSTGAIIGNIATTNGTISNRLGFDGVGGMIGTTSAHDLSFQTNNLRHITLKTNGNFGIGIFAPTEKLHVGGIGRFTEGILLKNENGSLDVLNHYESTEYGTDLTFSNSSAATRYSYRVTRVGNVVTVCLPAERITLTAAGAAELVFSTQLPPRYRPNTADIRQPIQVLVNGSVGAGCLIIKTDGSILLRPSIQNSLALWTGILNCGFFASSVSYVL